MRSWIRRHALEVVLLVIILIVGGGLRWYDVGPAMHFGTDEGRDAFVVHGLVTGEDAPLLGPAAPNNRPDFHLGPLFYYMLAPFYLLGGSSPQAGAVAIALFSTLTIFMVYVVGRQLWGWIGGLSAAAIFSTSFFMVYYGRWVWNPNFVPFFMLLFVWFMIKLLTEQNHHRNGGWLYGATACLGVLMQLHGTALLVVPVLLVALLVWYRPVIGWVQYVIGLGIILLVNAPAVGYDVTHRFANSRGFLRVLTQSDSTAGLSLGARADRLVHLVENFFQDSLTHGLNHWFWIPLAIILAGFGIWQLIRTVRKRIDRLSVVLIGSWLGITLMIFLFYQEAIPPHYFVVLFPLPFLLVGWLAAELFRTKIWRIPVFVLILGLLAVQLWWSVQLLIDVSPNGSRASSYPVRLDEMQWTVNRIGELSDGAPFAFQSLPLGNYDTSYQYLFDRADMTQSDDSANTDYVVVVDSLYDITEATQLGAIGHLERHGALWLLQVEPVMPVSTE